MDISIDALGMCAKKYNHGKLLGIETPEYESVVNFSEKQIQKIIYDLHNSGLVDDENETPSITLFGQQILDMLTVPEIMISIDNRVLNLSINVYLKDAYYLLSLKKNNGTDDNRLILKLLPDLKMVVGAFIFALRGPKGSEKNEKSVLTTRKTIIVKGCSWNKNREQMSRICIEADYTEQGLKYICNKETDDIKINTSHECELSTFINLITQWVLNRISDCYLRRGKNND